MSPKIKTDQATPPPRSCRAAPGAALQLAKDVPNLTALPACAEKTRVQNRVGKHPNHQMEDGDDVWSSALQPPAIFLHMLFASLRNSPQKTFNHDEVQGVVSESVESVLGTATYSHSKVTA
jgi:hypothetical protein